MGIETIGVEPLITWEFLRLGWVAAESLAHPSVVCGFGRAQSCTEVSRLKGIEVLIAQPSKCLLLAPSASSRRCSDMAADSGTPDGRWTRPIPPLPTDAVEKRLYVGLYLDNGGAS